MKNQVSVCYVVNSHLWYHSIILIIIIYYYLILKSYPKYTIDRDIAETQIKKQKN